MTEPRTDLGRQRQEIRQRIVESDDRDQSIPMEDVDWDEVMQDREYWDAFESGRPMDCSDY